jgi:hypothetical protein
MWALVKHVNTHEELWNQLAHSASIKLVMWVKAKHPDVPRITTMCTQPGTNG